jgi:tetratricopeptide (TPR) repeat protein
MRITFSRRAAKEPKIPSAVRGAWSAALCLGCLLWMALMVASCAGRMEVARVVDGRMVEGAFVPPEAYAAFLRGAIAEERGELAEALGAYSEAAAHHQDDPEVWTRIGGVRCALNPRDPKAEESFKRALGQDSDYAPAWAARARCALSRGESQVAARDAARAVAADAMAVEPQVMLARAERESQTTHAARDRLLALTLLHGSSQASWDALAAWARSHGDAALAATALARIAVLAPSRRAELGARAVELAGEGELSAARSLAASILDSEGDRSSGGEGPAAAASPLLARLAVDEALVRGSAESARRRASRAHLGLDLVAGRALVLGDARLARLLAEPLAAADPRAVGARMVLVVAALEQGDRPLLSPGVAAGARDDAKVSPEALLPFARALARVASVEAARRVLETTPHDVLLAGDPVFTPLVVDLAASGALDDGALPLDARIELAARRLEAPPMFPSPSEDAARLLDPRHRLFALALTRPLDWGTAELARHLASAASSDPLIAVAFMRIALAHGASSDPAMLNKLAKLNPADPIIAAAVLDLAEKRGDVEAIAPARARLTALARTPGERAHALE